MSRLTAMEIEQAAADWAARADRGLSPAEEAALDAWLAGDTRCEGAYLRLRSMLIFADRARALGPGFGIDAFSPVAPEPESAAPIITPQTAAPSLTRRRAVWAGGALAAGLAGAVGVGLTLQGRGQGFRTNIGEMKVVPLPDGSVMTLNTASTVHVLFGERERHIRLIAGEALFDVAKDAQRPFVVDAGGALVRAVGTSFTVSRLADAPVQVLVREGVVEVTRRTSTRAASAPVRVAANTRATASSASDSGVVAVAVTSAVVGRELAWREGRIAFENETLAAATEQLARYSDTRIVIDDPSIAAEEISGLFQANDPVAFARSASLAFGLRAEMRDGQIHLGR